MTKLAAIPVVAVADATDIALLKSVLNAPGISPDERAECIDNLDRITHRGGKLSKKVRSQAQAIADRCGVQVAANLVSRGLVPRGREVETPFVLRRENLPMKPPGRK